MARTKTDSFILELKLKTSPADDAYLEKCFSAGCSICNTLVRHCRRQIASLRQDKDYRKLLAEYCSPKKGKERSAVAKRLNAIVASYGLTEYSLHDFVKVQQKKHKKYINSHVAQKVASSVWRGVEKVLYGEGKYLHFRKWKDFLSLEGKNNTTGLVFQGGILKVNQRPVHARRQKKDGSPARRYEEEALTRRVKYCRLVRKPVGRRYHYYVQLVLEGKPPRKGYTLGEGAGGLDIGTSTAAVVTDTECILTVLGDGIESIEKKQWKLQRKMDRSRRAMNPQNYNPDGTVKKGRKKWTNSSHYRRMQMEYASLCRRRAAALKQWQEVMANRIVSQCDIIYVEQMNFKALQRKAKTSAVKENGKHTRRKRFGKSLQSRAPAQFCCILERKITALGGRYLEVDTRSFRASQYDHTAGTYTKKKLSRRHATIDGHWVQRDLYSAFLLSNSAEDLSHADRDRCIRTFDRFLKNHDVCIASIRNTKTKIPRSFGFQAA